MVRRRNQREIDKLVFSSFQDMLKQSHKQVKNNRMLQQVQHLFKYREQINNHQVVFNQQVHFIPSQVWIHPLKWPSIFLMLIHHVYHRRSMHETLRIFPMNECLFFVEHLLVRNNQ